MGSGPGGITFESLFCWLARVFYRGVSMIYHRRTRLNAEPYFTATGCFIDKGWVNMINSDISNLFLNRMEL